MDHLCLAEAAVQCTHSARACGCWIQGRCRGTGGQEPGCSHKSRIGGVCVCVCVCVVWEGCLEKEGWAQALPPPCLPTLTTRVGLSAHPPTCAGGSLGITPSSPFSAAICFTLTMAQVVKLWFRRKREYCGLEELTQFPFKILFQKIVFEHQPVH